jgi:hypothetical protein
VDGFPNDTSDDASPSANDGAAEVGADVHVDAPPVDDEGSSGDVTQVSEAANDGALADAGADASLEAGPATHTVFVSSTVYDGNLGGLTGADAKCQTLATTAGLAGTYKAWLSDSTTSAASRLTHASGPYVLVDGTVVAQDWSHLSSTAGLLHAIDLTETGGSPPIGTFQCGAHNPTVWTSTDASGQSNGPVPCSDWKSSVGEGSSGTADTASYPHWTLFCSYPNSAACAETAALYCMQQ